MYGIKDVTVWDENGDVVEGFSIDDFEAQFIEDEHKGIKKGDKVRIITRRGADCGVCEVLFYNTRTCEFAIRTERGLRRSESYYHLKKVA